MSEYIEKELIRLRSKKSLLLAELGQYVYYQYRIGQFMSEELKSLGDQLSQLDQEIYKLQNKELNESLTYCSCGNPLTEDDHYCSKCGHEVNQETIIEPITCSHCGTDMMTQASFCFACGSKLGKQQEGVE